MVSFDFLSLAGLPFSSFLAFFVSFVMENSCEGVRKCSNGFADPKPSAPPCALAPPITCVSAAESPSARQEPISAETSGGPSTVEVDTSGKVAAAAVEGAAELVEVSMTARDFALFLFLTLSFSLFLTEV